MKSGFAPYAAQLLPCIIEKASQEAGVFSVSADEEKYGRACLYHATCRC